MKTSVVAAATLLLILLVIVAAIANHKDNDTAKQVPPAPIVILVPYRKRRHHLQRFKRYMYRFFHNEADVRIVVVEQGNDKGFNRAWLTNVGLSYLLEKEIASKCVVQHDVDRFPKNHHVDYANCDEYPVQLNSENDQWGGGVPYPAYTGGVISMSMRHWVQVNGMTNTFDGYGGEDDDLFFRLRANMLLDPESPGQIRRPPKGNGQFSEWHDQFHTGRGRSKEFEQKMFARLKEMARGSSIWQEDGLNSVEYTITSIRISMDGRFTHIVVT